MFVSSKFSPFVFWTKAICSYNMLFWSFSSSVFSSSDFYQSKIILQCHSKFTLFVSNPVYKLKHVDSYFSTSSSYITVLAIGLPFTPSLFSVPTFLFSSSTSLFSILISLFSCIVYFVRGNVSLCNYLNTETKRHI